MKTGPQFVCHTREENMQDLKDHDIEILKFFPDI